MERHSVEQTGVVVPSKDVVPSKAFHRQAKGVKLHGARVVGSEPTDRKETLN
jgi:hypothetical protein